MQFTKVTIADKPLIDGYLSKHSSLSSDIDFASGFIWSCGEGYRFAEQDDVLFLCNSYYDSRITFAPPITKGANDDLTPAFLQLEKYCDENGLPFFISGMTDELIRRTDESYLRELNVIYDRASAEYVYNTADLIDLNRTKQLRDKLNRIRKFEDNYIINFREYKDSDRPSLMALYSDWEQGSNHHDSAERNALNIALDNLNALQLNCGVLEVDGVVRAFAIGGRMYQGMSHVMFEKADTSYYGIYQAINRYFTQRYLSSYTYVNRQEDLGIEGLRRAKKSYEPCLIIDKYRLYKKPCALSSSLK